MFAPAFAPFGNPEAIVNNKLVLAFLHAGWEVDVITRNLADESEYNYGSKWVEPWLPLKDITHTVDYVAGGKFRRIVESVWGGFRMGHLIAGCRWASYAYELGLALHKQKKYNFIMSRALPFSAHLPAMKLSKDTGVPWIANWNDPWHLVMTSKAKGNLTSNLGLFYSHFCKLVKSRSVWMTFPSEYLRQCICRYLGQYSLKKSSVIPHVALAVPYLNQYRKGDVFKICYAGRLWTDQDPTMFLKALKNVMNKKDARNKIEFKFIGIDDIGLYKLGAAHQLQSNIICLGRLDYLETLERCANSDVLLIIDPLTYYGIQLRSKVVDYVQTGRPILAISPKHGTTNDILSTYGGGIAVDCTSDEKITEALEKLYDHWERGTLDENYSSERLCKLFSPETIINSYRTLFEKLASS
jgi:glycosyltransferase involved in cell wall biosynthesis